ncbi:MAG: glucosamine-6-phosphate deaminase [Ginsengibacter sp.]
MKITIENTYEEISREAVKDLLQILQRVENPLLCTASGDSPRGLYKELIKQVKENDIDISAWTFLSLDEWLGMNEEDEGSCRFHLNNDLFNPLNVDESKIIFFDGRAADPMKECSRIEKFIEDFGGIDLAIVGLGMNGHVGMNEPGTSSSSRIHIAEIDSTTQTVGQKYFKSNQQLTHGLTLGVYSILEARTIMLIVSGTKKASIVREVLEMEISEARPASFLHNHENFFVYLDSAAASQLKQKSDG